MAAATACKRVAPTKRNNQIREVSTKPNEADPSKTKMFSIAAKPRAAETIYSMASTGSSKAGLRKTTKRTAKNLAPSSTKAAQRKKVSEAKGLNPGQIG